MADFTAVLKKTIEGLGNSSPATRQKVYEKARQAIRAKLAAANPPMPDEMAKRQLKALEDAIETVEFDFRISDAVTIATPTAPRTSPFASSRPAPAAAPAPQPAPVRPSEPARMPPVADLQTPVRKIEAPPPRQPATPAYRPAPAPPVPEEFAPAPEAYAAEEVGQVIVRKRNGMALFLAALAFLLVAGGGAAAWVYKDRLSAMVASLTGPSKPSAPAKPAEPAKPSAPAVATAEPTPATEEAAGPAKFTQRLTEDGREIDAGPAGGGVSVGEGTSVASATADQGAPLPGSAADTAGDQAPAGDAGQQPAAAAAPQPTAPVTTAPTVPAVAAEEAVPVGQKTIFYEERTNAASGSADTGSVVWSLVKESPGGDLPAEPAIRAEATVPERNLKLRMTIRRNGDKTLPASHIVEMVISGPENPASGAIDNILRMTFKESEAATGNPLFGVPAKIADGFFLIALTDSKAEVEANTTLMKREKWIDIPFAYGSGRRALITLEKGIPGEKVFDEAFKAWEGKASG